jgi:Sulfotransferase family
MARTERALERESGLRYLLAGEGVRSAREVAVRATRLYQRDRWRVSPRRLARSVDAVPLEGPIFVLGVQGGGTTLISRALRRHPSVVSVSGGSEQWTGTDELGVIPNRIRRLPASFWGSKFRADVEHPILGTNHSSVYACDELLPFYRREPEYATAAEAHAFKRFVREHLAVYGRGTGSRFIDKTHTFTVRVAFLARLLDGHRPHFVLVVRNPYATCTRVLASKPPSFRFELPHARKLALVAEHWENSMRLAMEDGEGVDSFTVVRLEDFLARPEATITDLAGGIGLDVVPEMTPRPEHEKPFATLSSDRKWWPLEQDRGLSEVSWADADIIGARCGVLAERFGYRLDEAGRPTSDVTSQASRPTLGSRSASRGGAFGGA